ncbi:MAG: rRNA maturation RNase YbeY [Paludibacteraceae bacterium]
MAEDTEFPSIEQKKVTAWIKDTVNLYSKKDGRINYIFCSDERILEVNRQYLQHDYYTDIITFDYSQGNKISGDIFISLDTVKSNSVEQGTDYKEELLRIIIHGVLHLCGQNDKLPEDKAEMTHKENQALAHYLDS